MAKLIRIFLLALIGIFVQFGFLGTVGAVLLKLLILAGIAYELYDLWRSESDSAADERYVPEESEQEEDALQEPLPFFDIVRVNLKNLLDFDGQYSEFLKEQFSLIWNLILPHNGYIFYQGAKDTLRLIYKRNRPGVIGTLSQGVPPLFDFVRKQQGILIENNLQEANHILPFYGADSFRPQSFLAFVTDFNGGERLYWIFDADSADFFNHEDEAALHVLNRNVKLMLTLAMQKKSLSGNLQENAQQLRFAQQLNGCSKLEEGLETLADFLVQQFEASKLTIAVKSNNDKAIIKKAVGIEDPFKEGYEFSLDEGLNGWVILKNKPYLIENIDKGDYFIPRFTRTEKTNYGLRAFLSVPLHVDGQAAGLITLEDKRENIFTKDDKERLKQYSDIFSLSLKRFNTENTIGG